MFINNVYIAEIYCSKHRQFNINTIKMRIELPTFSKSLNVARTVSGFVSQHLEFAIILFSIGFMDVSLFEWFAFNKKMTRLTLIFSQEGHLPFSLSFIFSHPLAYTTSLLNGLQNTSFTPRNHIE